MPHPRAGLPCQADDLLNVPRLVTAYYAERPDAGVAAQRVVFGTSGHRGSSLTLSFNEAHILAISQAICLYRKHQNIDGPLFLGIDTHALSVPAMASAIEVLAANGVEVMIAGQDEYTPTPVISHAILAYNHGRKTGQADGIVVTPSHNPPHDGGFKYNPPNGGPAEPEVTGWIQDQANGFLENGLAGVKRIPYEQALHAPTTHRHDYLTPYVEDLGSVIEMQVIARAKISLGVDPLGGAGVHYWPRIAERYGLNLTVVNNAVDPTFRFMTLDWDGQIRMDPSSPYAMRRLIDLKDRYQIAFACDTDHDRHGVVTRSRGLLPPNHYLAVAVSYLFQHRPQWPPHAAVGKTLVSSQMIDRVANRLGRKLYEVPVGFKWFVPGLLDGSLGFGGEESAGASFLRQDGAVWTTDKDGIVPALLAAEMTARLGKDPGEIYQELTQQLGDPVYDRLEAPATPEQKERLARLAPEEVRASDLAGEKIQRILSRAPGNGEPIGGLKVIAENGWFAARPSGTEDIYKIYAESFRGQDHLRRIIDEARTIVKDALEAVPGEGIMTIETRFKEPVNTALPESKDGAELLIELALDLRWSWNHAADALWERLDPSLWKLTHNPWVLLQTASRENLRHVLADRSFRAQLDHLVETKRKAATEPSWFQTNHANSALSCAAYFSMEFMLSEALPIYSGGLGNVAGDQLKAASDLGVPVVGVGLLYQQGYFRQVIDRNGYQQALYPYNDPGQLPIQPVRQANGEWLRLEISLPGFSVWLRAWEAQVGRAKLYLLDSNDAANFPPHRGITGELYGGGPELRLKQELVLGIGGWRLLRALGLTPDVCHLNEGHAAFAVLERARTFMADTGQPFDVALAATRAGNLFTTHTAVAAGFDRFSPDLMAAHLEHYAQEKLGIALRDLLALGRQNPDDASEPFNMAYLAIRGSGAVNAVSRLHGEVSRRLFQPLFPRWPEEEVPVGYVTNGVHVPSWDSGPADDLWTHACAKDRWRKATESLNHDIRKVPDAQLWGMRTASRTALVEYARERLSQQLALSGESSDAVENAKRLFDPQVLTLGFARRFAPYKRPNLLLRDAERLLRLLSNPERPVQLIMAGKAHPADGMGQALIHEWIQFIRRPEARTRVIFLSDYDMLLTERLVQGVDVWINTPRRPWEASGTSGMKVLVNGGLNLSELDGWWAEAYAPEVGWALGDGREHGEDPAWDAAEARALYDLLEREIIPEFYARDEKGIPAAWVARIRESMARLTPRFSTNRTVRQYTEHHYLPAAVSHRKRAQDKGAVSEQLVRLRQALDQKWDRLRFGESKVETVGKQHVFEIKIYLNDLDPAQVQAELFANGSNGSGAERHAMARLRPLTDEPGAYLYHASVSSARPTTDYTARLIPRVDGAEVPLEMTRILWQR